MSDFLRTVAKYSDAQPRWPEGTPVDPATGGGGGRWRATDSTPHLGAKNVLEGYSEHAHLNEKGWIVTSSVDDAVKALNEGKHVELLQPREVATLLDRLAALAEAAEAAGEKAPVYDLCKVSVKGTNLFCADALDIERNKMPQFIAIPKPGSKADQLPKRKRGTVDAAPLFIDYLKDKGYTVTDTQESAAYLRASQRQLNGAKVGQMMGWLRNPSKDPYHYDPPLLVSEDNYIIDGHHRWAAHVGLDAEDNDFGDVKMNIRRVNIRIIPLLMEANEFADEIGMTRAGVGDMLKKAWLHVAKEAVWREEDHPRGKTTPESTPGSFAPGLAGQRNVLVEGFEYKRPSVRYTEKVNVIFNPTRDELRRWSAGEVRNIRWLRWNGNTVFWNSYEALHKQVADALHKEGIVSADTLSAIQAAYAYGNLTIGGNIALGDSSLEEMLRRDSTLYDDLFPLKKSWLQSLIQLVKEAADWVEAEHPRGKTTPESNAGSFAPKNTAQGELFDYAQGVKEALHDLRATVNGLAYRGAHAAKIAAAATEVAKAEASLMIRDILSGEDVHDWITAEMLQNEALAPMVEQYLLSEQRDKAVQKYAHNETSELLRKDVAFGDQALSDANIDWAQALDHYIGNGYDEINGYFRGESSIDPEDTDEFKEYVSQFMNEEENEVLATAQEQYVAQNLNDWITEDERWDALNDRLAAEEITQEEFESELSDLRNAITDERLEGFTDSDYYTDAMADLEERAKNFAREAVTMSQQDRATEAEDKAREIQDLINNRPATPITTIMRRGVNTGKSINWDNLKPGDLIEFSGFTSMSSKRSVAENWKNKTIEFVIPAGSKDVLFTTNDGEGEVILNHGVKATVLSRTSGRLVVYYHPEGDGEDPEEDDVEKADAYIMNFGRLHTEPTIVPFMPVLKGDYPGHPFRGNQYTTIVGSPGIHTIRVKRQKVQVIVNPARTSLARFAEDIGKGRLLRYIHRGKDSIWWNAADATHWQMIEALGLYEEGKDYKTSEMWSGDAYEIGNNDYKNALARLDKYGVFKDDWDESEHPRGETVEGTNKGSFRPKNTGFVSPNIDEQVGFDEAVARQSSERTKLLQSAAQEAAEYFNVSVHDSVGVGAWADGAEQSLIVSGDGDPEDFKAYMAFMGLLGDQKAVVDFTNDSSGPDTVFRLSVGNRNLKDVHQQLLDAGVQFHTLRQTDHNVDVFVFAPGTEQETTDAVARAAQAFGNVGVAVIKGRGEFVGSWNTREEGRARYEEILDAHGRRVHGHDRGWTALRDRWAGRIATVRKSWLQEVLKWDESQHPRGKTTPESNSGSFTFDEIPPLSEHAAAENSAYSAALRVENPDPETVRVVSNARREKREAWEAKVVEAVMTGRITPEQAQALGYNGNTQLDVSPLPERLYHVTTAAHLIADSGLKTNYELGRDVVRGLGSLGGGENVVSFSDNEEYANLIRDAMVLARSVARGETSIQDLIRMADEGEGAKHPWGEDLRNYLKSEYGMAVSGKKPVHAFFDMKEVQEAGIEYVKGTPTKVPPDWVQTDTHTFLRPMSEKELAGAKDRFFSAWLAFRGEAGGPENPLFTSEISGLANLPEHAIGVVEVRARPGARGHYLPAEHEYRTVPAAVEVVKIRKSWLHIAKEAVWREEEHPRGKTTAESNEGSFAPTDFKSFRSFKLEQAGRGAVEPVSSPQWLDGQARTVRVMLGERVSVIKNPTQQELSRFIGRGGRVRYSIDFASGNYAAWDGAVATHWEVERALGIAGYKGGISANNEDLIPAGAVLQHMRYKVLAAFKENLLTDDQYDTLMEKLGRVSKSWLEVIKEAVWREEEHPRGKTTPESNAGSFAPADDDEDVLGDVEEDPIDPRYAAPWDDGTTRKMDFVEYIPDYPHPRKKIWTFEVLKNPRPEQVAVWAGREFEWVRSVGLEDRETGKLDWFYWDADFGIHDRLWSVISEQSGRRYSWTGMKTYERVADIRASLRKSSWLDTIMKYLPTQPRWPEGTPVDDTTGAGGGRWAPSDVHAGYNFPKDAEGKPIKGEQWRDAKGNPVSPEIAARLKGIPPGYTDIVLNADPTAPCIAIAKDSKGREKRMFSKEWHGGQALKKWDEIRRFNQDVPQIRQKVEQALETARGKDLIAAQVIYVLDVTGYRIGGGEDELADNDAFGLTTLTASHVKVNGDKVSFGFPGKKGVWISKTVEDKRLADIFRNAKADAKRNQPLFDVSASKVNSYLKELTGTTYSAKDFRTWNGTTVAIIEMGKWKTRPRTEKEFKARQRVVLDKVAAWLGNTRAVAKSSYVDPAVWEWWKV